MSPGSQSISPSDLEEAYRILGELDIATDRARFAYHAETDQWCLHDGADDSCIAKRAAPPNAIEWAKV